MAINYILMRNISRRYQVWEANRLRKSIAVANVSDSEAINLLKNPGFPSWGFTYLVKKPHTHGSAEHMKLTKYSEKKNATYYNHRSESHGLRSLHWSFLLDPLMFHS